MGPAKIGEPCLFPHVEEHRLRLPNTQAPIPSCPKTRLKKSSAKFMYVAASLLSADSKEPFFSTIDHRKDVVLPYVESDEEAYVKYSQYARNIGFSIHIHYQLHRPLTRWTQIRYDLLSWYDFLKATLNIHMIHSVNSGEETMFIGVERAGKSGEYD
ncbi:hypothetical protein KSP40_PGU019357 [Platanthera guangdongensis]|uniref:Uncharacterized protein n=1 Tax=Platanthera guangdongensis TaxID=2320717 RepID=A0ABR2LEA9_9ASPA